MRKAIAKRRTVWAGVVALLAASVGVLTVTAGPVSASVRDVANDQEYRDALAFVSGDASGPHVINITADFTITEPGDPTYANLTQPLTINGNGHTIDGGGSHRILFQRLAGGALTVNDLTVVDGYGRYGRSVGGIDGLESVTVTNSTFTGNAGAAIGAYGPVSVTNSTFTDNTSNRPGAAITSGQGQVTVTNST